MKKFKPSVWNRLEYQKSTIAAEVKSSDLLNKRWIGIYSSKKEGFRYKILEIELPKSIIEKELDWEESEEKYFNEVYIKNEDELYLFLNQRNINPESFDAPWHSKYPYH